MKLLTVVKTENHKISLRLYNKSSKNFIIE